MLSRHLLQVTGKKRKNILNHIGPNLTMFVSNNLHVSDTENGTISKLLISKFQETNLSSHRLMCPTCNKADVNLKS